MFSLLLPLGNGNNRSPYLRGSNRAMPEDPYPWVWSRILDILVIICKSPAPSLVPKDTVFVESMNN